jgi:ATP-dependent helicase HrpB
LTSGHGAVQLPESTVRDGEFLVALELRAGTRGPGSEARVRLASRVERAWLGPTRSESLHEIDRQSGVVRAVARDFYGALVLGERDRPVDPGTAASQLRDAMLARGLGPGVESALRRLAFAAIAADVPTLLLAACHGRSGWFEFDLLGQLTREQKTLLDRLAPESLVLPSGRRVRLEYREDGSVAASAKLQELFGLAATPRIGREETPVAFTLLAPNGRPVQTTRDLQSFWSRTYAEVRRELRGRYPKHEWPEDPWTARPSGRSPKRWPRAR